MRNICVPQRPKVLPGALLIPRHNPGPSSSGPTATKPSRPCSTSTMSHSLSWGAASTPSRTFTASTQMFCISKGNLKCGLLVRQSPLTRTSVTAARQSAGDTACPHQKAKVSTRSLVSLQQLCRETAHLSGTYIPIPDAGVPIKWSSPCYLGILSDLQSRSL